MPEQTISPEEHRIMQDAFVYLKEHCCPPLNDGSDATLAWWRKATADANTLVSTKWQNHMLASLVISSVYAYLNEKAKEATTHVQSL